MSVPMSKEEIDMTLEVIHINESIQKQPDRVVPRIIAYIEANIDDFMECYNDDD